MPQMPSSLPARYSDQLQWAARAFYEPLIHLVLHFHGEVDLDRLKRALRLTLDAEPVFGCRYVSHWLRSRWRRLSEDDLDQAELLRVAEGDDQSRQQAMDDFLAEPLAPLEGPQIRALLLKGKGERLVIKVNHQAADAGGVKDLAYILAELYRKLEKNPDYEPAPNTGTRSLHQVYAQVIPGRLIGLFRGYFPDLFRILKPYKSVVLPMGDEWSEKPCFLTRQLPEKKVQAMRRYGAKTGASLNDILTAAFFRVLIKHGESGDKHALRCYSTVDLRRYMPGGRAESCCNLTFLFYPKIPRYTADKFTTALNAVKKDIDQQKNACFGLSPLFVNYLLSVLYPSGVKRFGYRFMTKQMIKGGNLPPFLTNMGPVNADYLNFGSIEAVRAYLLPPAMYPPVLAVGVSGYRGALTLSLGYFKPALPKAKADKFMEDWEKELPG